MRDVINLHEEELSPAWRAPNGLDIVGTAESIPGTCGIYWPAAGSEWLHDGTGTDVGWDGQETLIWAGEVVYVDEGGSLWIESQLIKDPAAPVPETIESPWNDRGRVSALIGEALGEVFEITETAPEGLNSAQAVQYHGLVESLTNLIVGLRK